MSARSFTQLVAVFKAGPFIGPRGGKWADAKHTKPWKELMPAHRVRAHVAAMDTGGKHGKPPLVDRVADVEHVKTTLPLASLDVIEPGNTGRVEEYAKRKTPIPAIRGGYNARSHRRGKSSVYVIDGNHRVAAAKLRGDTHIEVIMPTADLERWNNPHNGQKGGVSKAGGPFIGPRGGKWADPQHKIPWKETSPRAGKEAMRRAVHRWVATGGGWSEVPKYVGMRDRAKQLFGDATYKDTGIPKIAVFDAVMEEYKARQGADPDDLAERDPRTQDRSFGPVDLAVVRGLSERMGQGGGGGGSRDDFTSQERQILDAVSFFTNGNVPTVRDPSRWSPHYLYGDPKQGYTTVAGPKIGENRPPTPKYGEIDEEAWRGYREDEYETPPGSQRVYQDAHDVMKQLAQAPVEDAPVVQRGMGIEFGKLPKPGEHLDLSDVASFSSNPRNAVGYAKTTGGMFVGVDEGDPSKERYYPIASGAPSDGYPADAIPSGTKVPVILRLQPLRGTSIQTMSHFVDESEFITGGRVNVVSVELASTKTNLGVLTKVWVVEVEHV